MRKATRFFVSTQYCSHINLPPHVLIIVGKRRYPQFSKHACFGTLFVVTTSSAEAFLRRRISSTLLAKVEGERIVVGINCLSVLRSIGRRISESLNPKNLSSDI